MIAEKLDKIQVSPTMQVSGEAKRMKSEGINVIDLSVGEPDFPTPINIKEAAKRAIDNNQTKYTINAGTVELRKAITEKFKNDNKLDYSIKEIIVSSGAKQSVFNAIFAVVNENDEVIIPAPYWVSYPDMVHLAGAVPKIVVTDEQSGFKITPEQLKQSITGSTKALILCNPSNPTGSAYTEIELRKLAEVISGSDFYIIADEIYEKLVYDDFKFISFASLNDEMKKRTLVVNGVSKSYSMTGWRIGYTAGAQDVISAMDKIQSHSTSHPGSISQAAALEALTGPQSSITESVKEFKLRRDYLYNELVNIKGISCYKPEGAFYLYPNISSFFGKSFQRYSIKNSVDLALYLLQEANIACVPGSAFGTDSYLRISYATSIENLKTAVGQIKTVLGKLV